MRGRVVGGRCAAVVVNFETPDTTLETVRSLREARRPLDEIIVVENGSRDGSADRLRAALTSLTFLETDRNLGFSGGCNVGIRHALAHGAQRVLLVNSDAFLPPECLGHLESTLDGNPGLGIVGPAIVARSSPPTILSAGISYSPRSGWMRNLGFGRPYTPSSDHLRPVAAVSGCVMLVDRAVFDRVGLFDEDYFFSFEDLDFCLRAERAGFRSACLTGVPAYHLGSHSIGPRSPLRVYYGVRNHLLLAERGHPGNSRRRLMLRKASVVLLNIAYAIRSPDVPKVSGFAALVRGVRDHLRRRHGPA